jgi:hypothetical protein
LAWWLFQRNLAPLTALAFENIQEMSFLKCLVNVEFHYSSNRFSMKVMQTNVS